ncbi:hypothetical protein SI65_07154 [Aspergillus cristatus]|uniref:Uncharacterized protein n=1 Tax=Aspergillus cristatus TaxID=573508 RepID=A0A1E3B977_ASPCR|nr:hypothetical protein SI65_07154 [Aspergillus cristatus]
MATYLSFPILDILVQSVEDSPSSADAVKAVASGILAHYFPASNGFAVTPVSQPQPQPNRDTLTLRIQRHRHVPGYPAPSPDRQGLVDHIVTVAKANCDAETNEVEDLWLTMKDLEHTLDHANTESGRCWGLMVYATTFTFYEYHRDLPEDRRLVCRGSYHVRCDDSEIDRELRYLARADASFTRDGGASD